MGQAIILASQLWTAPSGVGPFAITCVGAGGPGTNGFDTGTSGGVGRTGTPGQVVSASGLTLSGAYYVEVGQPRGVDLQAEVALTYGGVTSFGNIMCAASGVIDEDRTGPAPGPTNETGYGTGGPAGEPGDPLDSTLGQPGAVIIEWAEPE